MTCNPIDRQELARRYNEFERVVPIYRAALERIAGEHVTDPRLEARAALREADREDSRR
jgi:hypothetical protein